MSGDTLIQNFTLCHWHSFSNILYYMYTHYKNWGVIIWKNIQFCQKDFYFCLLCCNYFWFFYVFPVYPGHLNVLEQNRSYCGSRDYASSMLGGTGSFQSRLFCAPPEIYTVITLIYVHLLPTVRARSSSFALILWHDTVAKQLNCFYQNLESMFRMYWKVYLPKFSVYLQNYIFDSRKFFLFLYKIRKCLRRRNSWLVRNLSLNNTGISFYSDQLTVALIPKKQNSLNFSIIFYLRKSQCKNALVIVQLDPDGCC